MIKQEYFDRLKSKYNYDDKTIRALSNIIPAMIKYYGKKYEELILNAISSVLIISCKSDETINKVLDNMGVSPLSFDEFALGIDSARGESVYVPSVNISYNEKMNKYEIAEIKRAIVTSHTFNYDSLKGMEVLTHALCHLVKGYFDEFVIDENVLVTRNGLSEERRKINYNDGDISLELISSLGKALEEGITIYDTESIISILIKDDYKVYDYDTIYTIASVLKETYNMKEELEEDEIYGGADKFIKKYGEEDALNLFSLCDRCVETENEMRLSYSRDDKNALAEKINKVLTVDVFSVLMIIYERRKERLKNRQ